MSTQDSREDLLAGLGADDQAVLASLSTKALELESRRLLLQSQRLQFQALGVGDETAIRRGETDLVAGEGAIAKELATSPQLARPLASIRNLAKAAQTDPQAAEQLKDLRTRLAPLEARGEEMAARREDPTSERTMLAKEARKEAEYAAMGSAQDPRTSPLANELEGEGLSGALATRYNPKAIPESVASRYSVRGKEFIDGAKVAFVDLGNRLQTDKSFDGYAVRSMVDIAEARGWESIKVTGDEAFRRAVWYEAATRGIQVKGYKPSEAEQQAAASAAERNGRLNRVEENLAVRAFSAAKDPEARKEAVRAHPELKSAFALEAALQRFADAKLRPGDREAFMERQRQNISRDVAQGNALPSIAIRTQRQQHRDRYAESER